MKALKYFYIANFIISVFILILIFWNNYTIEKYIDKRLNEYGILLDDAFEEIECVKDSTIQSEYIFERHTIYK